MPDIAMCKGDDCPLKEKCYRYLAKPDHYQSYFMIPPYKDGKCDHFWEVGNRQVFLVSKITKETAEE